MIAATKHVLDEVVNLLVEDLKRQMSHNDLYVPVPVRVWTVTDTPRSRRSICRGGIPSPTLDMRFGDGS